MEKFIIAKDYTKKVKRFNLMGRTLEFKIKPVPEKTDPTKWVKSAIDDIVLYATKDLAPTDRVGFTFCSKNFKKGDGWSAFREASQVTTDDIWDVIFAIFQSNSTGLSTDQFCLGVSSVKLPAGKGKVSDGKYNSFNEECSMRKGIVTIDNRDKFCLPRAIVVALANVDRDPAYRKVRRDIGKLQTERAMVLLKNAGVEIPEEGAGIYEINKLQQHLKNYKIIVYLYGGKGRDVMYEGDNEGKHVIHLLYHEGHFNVITSLTAAFACGYYCEECHIPYDHKNSHRCAKSCPCCQQIPPCQQEINISCDECNRKFRGQNCLDNHKSSICKMVKRCRNCLKTTSGKREHICGEIYCKICCAHVPSDHMCYMRPDTAKPKTEDILFIFYDLETMQDSVLEKGVSQHIPNLCVFKQCCSVCINTDKQVCIKCGPRLQILKSRDIIPSFMHHLLTLRKKFKRVVVLAHNGQAFDHQFMLNYILNETALIPELIMRGTKIILMQIGNMKFIDSVNYFPMALCKLPKAFELPAVFKKGYFPHLFNTEENENYVGYLPEVKYYDPDSMMPEDRNMFLKWYSEHKNDEFNMQRDIVDYCVSDVEILTRACLKFRELFLIECKVCPFTEACTIASACNKTFRRNFLKPNTIGLIPRIGYRWADNQSRIAIKWLIWEEHNRTINILHAAKQKEVMLNGIKVDGYSKETNTVFEFHGCYYHGHPVCLAHNRNDPLHDNPAETLNYRFESTVAKTDRLKNLGYEVMEMWECEFRRQLKSNREIESVTKDHPLLSCTVLNPRDAFYGGRTGNTKTYYKCKPEEKIKYVDVCSLYPWVCKYGKYPVGHPKVFVGEQCKSLNIKEIEGLIKCKILPTENLFHPVLPVKMHKKLLFALCRTCCENMNEGECHHNEEERAFIGTWVIDEVLKAVDKGYKIVDIYEIWKYDVEQYDTLKKVKGGLFTEMMNKFIKIKQQASGWPGDCVTQEQKDQYIEDFLKKEGVQLEFNEILKNAGLRSLAKLMLNSFWGKLGQRDNQPKASIVNNPGEFFKMLSNPSIIVNHILPINEDVLVVNWEYKEESYDIQSTVNVCLAAYTTTQARLKLYSYLEKLGERALYYDTDSVIYVSREGEYDVPVGNMLGEMTDELSDYGIDSYITEFASGGPKNYAYKVYSTKDNKETLVCKVKGIKLNYTASQKINFDAMKGMILSGKEDPIYITSNQIRRTENHCVITKQEEKIYRLNSTKRKFVGENSVPWGYKKLKM